MDATIDYLEVRLGLSWTLYERDMGRLGPTSGASVDEREVDELRGSDDAFFGDLKVDGGGETFDEI